jgi:hypothetical protein
MKPLSPKAIEKALQRLSDPKVNYRVDLASTPHVAKRIIQSLPGVKRLTQDGPEAEKAILALLQDEEKLEDRNLSAIGLYILESYPSDEVKYALAKPISVRRFRGLNSQLAADTFLKAAGIPARGQEAIAIAHREARKIQKERAKLQIDKPTASTRARARKKK